MAVPRTVGVNFKPNSWAQELILDPPPRGWYCWVYLNDDREFEEWMSRMCPTADCTRRFNSGDPMTTVYISEDSEATAFQLRWM